VCGCGRTYAQFCASHCSNCVMTSAKILCKSMLKLCHDACQTVCRDAHKKLCRDAKNILLTHLPVSDAGWSCDSRSVVNGISDVAPCLLTLTSCAFTRLRVAPTSFTLLDPFVMSFSRGRTSLCGGPFTAMGMGAGFIVACISTLL